MFKRLKVITKKYIKNSMFKYIIYVLKDNDTIIIEEPDTNMCAYATIYDINRYVQISKDTMPYRKLIDGSYVSIVDDRVLYCAKITPEIRKEWVNIDFRATYENNLVLDHLIYDNENFRITKSTYNELMVSAYLPILPLWVEFRERVSMIDQISYRVKTIWTEINNQFYRFPYGNVDSNDYLCMGTSEGFSGIKHFLFQFLVKTFKAHDYGVVIKHSKDYKNVDMPNIFNLDYIHKKIFNDETDCLSVLSIYYYLANLIELNDFNWDLLLYKKISVPWKIEFNETTMPREVINA